MKAWLKGGLIGLIIEIIFFFIIFFRKCDFTEMLGGGGCWWSLNNFVENLTHLLNEALIVKFIAFLILLAGFLIGGLIGWVVGKRRS